MKTILVTGVGGPTPRSFVRAVKMAEGLSEEYRFIGVDCNPLAYGLYDRNLFDKAFTVPRADDAGYWEVINDIIETEEIEGAVILPEVEVLEWAKNSGSKLTSSIKVHMPEYDLANTLVNKHRLHDLLEETDWVPAFRRVDPDNYSYDDLSVEVGDVFWIRSTEGSSGLGSLKIESESALAQWISINSDVKEFIATEYLPGRNMACKMLYFDGKLSRTACAERVNYIMAKVAPSGITGNTSFGRLINEPDLVAISEETLRFISDEVGSDLNGIFTVDFKEDADGVPKITEINIRHVAFTSSIAAGGANLPADTLETLFSGSLSPERIDYTYGEGLIFLRDVDSVPIIMKEKELLGEP
ncbi:hypothetical protein [Rhodohalobacter sp. 8-1]|uniref:hypothetical protein n=1 Tax=Rhodohalobacter sp. 8-1 TaxID=3131972 RepID=UPI0030EB4821